MAEPRITVVLPTRNIAAYLPHALHSVATQGGNWGLVAVDSASSDGTRELLAEFAAAHPERVQLIDAPKAKLSEAINLAIAAAAPGWIHWIGGDDRVAPGGHAAVRRAIAAHPDAKWLMGAMQFREADGSLGRVGQPAGWNRDKMLVRNELFAPSSLFTRDVALRAGLFSPVLRRTMDYEFWFRLAWLAQPVVVGDILAEFTIRNDALSGGQNEVPILRESIAIAQMYAQFNAHDQLTLARTLVGRYAPAVAKKHLRPYYLKLRGRTS